MPPEGKPQPKEVDRLRVARWIEDTFDDPKLAPRDPGHKVIHRLSRTEYNNTIRDLFGVDSKPADQFPADGGGGGGFDNNADTLFIPPVLMERYLRAAGDVLRQTPADHIFTFHPGKHLTARNAARKILDDFLPRAFRRPVQSLEVERYLRLFDVAKERGESFEDAVRLAFKGVLISPCLLYTSPSPRDRQKS